jgi:hypothetical protein
MSANERAGIIAFALVLAVCGCGDGTRPAPAEPTISMLDPDPLQRHYGLTYSEWAVAYMKWQFETSSSILLDVKDCTAGQNAERNGELGPVVFLERDLAARIAPRRCEFSSQKAVFFPLLSVTSLTPYYTDPIIKQAMFDVDPKELSPQQLERSIEDFMKRLVIDQVSIRVDGLELQDPLSGRIAPPAPYSYKPYRGDSVLFHLYGVQPENIPEEVENAFVSGYWILLQPLGPGAHELSVVVRGHTGGGDLQVIHEQFTYDLMLD